jgi:hypothetical protein
VRTDVSGDDFLFSTLVLDGKYLPINTGHGLFDIGIGHFAFEPTNMTGLMSAMLRHSAA